MHVSWIGGWGVDPAEMAPLARHYLPGESHCFLPPSKASVRAAANSDLVLGWSLGAWHLLNAAAEGIALPTRVVLLAPFVSFCSEMGQGGCCSRTQIKWLERWLQRDPRAALQDFYQRASLDLCPVAGQLPYSLAELLNGLTCLAQPASPNLVQFAAAGLPMHWTAVVGDQDRLLEANKIAELLPGCRIVASAGHSMRDLLKAVDLGVYAI